MSRIVLSYRGLKELAARTIDPIELEHISKLIAAREEKIRQRAKAMGFETLVLK